MSKINYVSIIVSILAIIGAVFIRNSAIAGQISETTFEPLAWIFLSLVLIIGFFTHDSESHN